MFLPGMTELFGHFTLVATTQPVNILYNATSATPPAVAPTTVDMVLLSPPPRTTISAVGGAEIDGDTTGVGFVDHLS